MSQVTQESLEKAISICAPGVEFKKIGKTIQYVKLIGALSSNIFSILLAIRFIFGESLELHSYYQ